MANGVAITITIDTSDVTRDLAATPQRVRRAIARSINRSLASGRVVMVREICNGSGLKARDVRRRLYLKQATVERLEGEMIPSRKSFPLIDYRAQGPFPSRGRGRGVTALQLGDRLIHENAFIAVMRTGHRGVFVRKTTDRLPIRELTGLSVSTMFGHYIDEGITRVEEALQTNLAHELAFVAAGIDMNDPVMVPDVAA